MKNQFVNNYLLGKIINDEDFDLKCDCCGDYFSITEDEPYVYQCSLCEDYAICMFCMYGKYHNKHVDSLIPVDIDVYRNSLWSCLLIGFIDDELRWIPTLDLIAEYCLAITVHSNAIAFAVHMH